MKKIFVLLIIVFVFLGTFSLSEDMIVKEDKVYPCVINIETKRQRQALEKDKCMSGVCLDGEYAFSGIKDFENKTNTKNDVYIKHIKNDESFPASFIIEGVSKGKTPMLIIDNTITNIEYISKCINSIYPKCFVAFDYGTNTFLYNKNAAILREISPLTSLMWIVDLENNFQSSPKEEYIDWVGIKVNENNDINLLRNSIKYFLNKPVALNVSVESFSKENHKYNTEFWNNKVFEIYNTGCDYENVALISYINNSHNNRVFGSSKISESERLRLGYKKAVDILPSERKWTSTDEIGYLKNDTAYIDIDVAKKLNIEEKYVNNKYAAIKNCYINKSIRKMFVYLPKM
ncbi:MAG: hypothetical protein ACI4VF_08760 [Lachnospirales bacterium]